MLRWTTLLVVATATGCGSDSDREAGDAGQADAAGIGVCNQGETTPYTFDLPEHFSDFDVPDHNVTTEEGVALGRRLYYDTKLSKGGPMEGHACATCHQQQASFSLNAPGVAVLSHVNHNWSTSFLWNGKIEGGLEEVRKGVPVPGDPARSE